MANPNFPAKTVTWTDKQNFVDDVDANDTNQLYAETIAIENFLKNEVTNETTRQTNESVRQANEEQRISDVDEMKAAYDAATKANLSLEVSNARGTFETLKERLDDSDTALADIPNQTYITEKAKTVDVNNALSIRDTQISSLASGSPKGTYATVSALTTAFPSGNTNIYVVTADGKWYYWNGSAWTAGGVYQSTGILDKSISTEKTDFIAIGKNLFNKDTAITGYTVAESNGNLAVNVNDFASDFIPVMPNTTYTRTGSMRICFYDSNKVFTRGFGNGLQPSTFTTGATECFIRVSDILSVLDTYQVELGSVATTYEKFNVSINNLQIKNDNIADESVSNEKLADSSVTPDKVSFLTFGKNLFNKKIATLGYVLQYTAGVIAANTNYFTSDFIPVTPNTTYTRSDSQKICFYNINKVFTRGFDTGFQPATFTTGETENYIRVSSASVYLDTYQVELGNTATKYSPYGYNLGDIILQTPNVSGLFGKSVAVLGDSIMMLQRSNDVTTNSVIDQAKLDIQDWDTLKTELGLSDLINLGLGATTVEDKSGEETTYPQPDDTTNNTNYLTNEVRWLKRLTDAGRNIPNCIMIWAGTNGGGSVPPDNYDSVMALSYDDLMSTVNKSIRQTFYGGLRATLEMLYRYYPYATIFVFSPIQTNPNNYRTYSLLSTKRDYLKKMANRYSCVFVDSLAEIGIVDFYENDLNDGTSRFLADGLHPNDKGKVLYKNYTSKRLGELYFSKV